MQLMHLLSFYHSVFRPKHRKSSFSATTLSIMGRKDKKQQQAKEEEKPAAEKNTSNVKGGKMEQPSKEGTSSYPVDQTATTFN
ncbi:unnamed protein product [Phytophthora fragariaefolia]|uniref:Unnamed protein product n=1 Tax=Phytophthora fragariaefolia TaxID=1490495 RepID=A0A9W6YP05_9STRA|nr:unnamed protein product [Phytophthora fragariaefolia]